MARQKGLEPLTHCLEGRCSIRLSYWRNFQRKQGNHFPPTIINYTTARENCPYFFAETQYFTQGALPNLSFGRAQSSTEFYFDVLAHSADISMACAPVSSSMTS